MRRTLGMMAVVGLLMATTSVMALQIKITDLPPTWNGGPFQAELLDGPNAGATFGTFCLELSESLAVPGTYDYVLESGARLGGVEAPADATPNFDEISWGTAWLYNQYRAGAIAVTDPAMIALQYTFWYLEDEIKSLSDMTFYNAAVAAGLAASISDITQDSLGAFGVEVINPRTSVSPTQGGDGVLRQSLLYKVPDGGLTVVLLGLGVMGCAALRRRIW